ncbi:MAG: rod shape-determining protein RodA [Elusimicrobia bacterium RIFOXYA2_FULL_39_19]|nr:MAG: rod shape-determining protein RodA [Elusimicrobia bacterium RIFOXYA2_FULL_39_19]
MRNNNAFIKNFKNIDWIILLGVIFLSVLGIILIFSATLRTGDPWFYVRKQTVALVFGLVLMILFTIIDYRIYKIYYQYIYYISIFLLFLVLIFGTVFKGQKAWIDFKYFAFQPSEITKLLFIVSLAGYLDKNSRDLGMLRKLFIPTMMLFGNIILILLQPDFSSCLVYFPVFLAMLYFSGARVLHILSFILFGIVTISPPLLKTLLTPYLAKTSVIMKILAYKWEFFVFLLIIGLLVFFLWWFLYKWKIQIPIFYFVCVFLIILGGVSSSYLVGKSIKEYQRKRLVVFINPEVDKLGAGYNIIQSKIAVGSGKTFGKGLFSGTQAQLGFVPAQHTDFIFSLLSEELGFVFSFLVIILYLLLIWRIVNVSYQSRDKYGSIVSAGLATMVAFYGIINIGMVVGLMPITGLPLLFISYGGSCLVSSFMAIGILFSIHIRRFMY